MAAAAALLFLGCAATEQPAAPGERAYLKCYGCHSLERGVTANGPSLHGIVGKAIAADPNFPYSEALRRLARQERVWSPQLIDRFIADPEAVAPGTDMGFFIPTSPDERAGIIAYLQRTGR